jgi:phosphoserine phosphatase RsbU/P
MSNPANLAREPVPTNGRARPARPWRSIRFQLLAAVNGTLVVIVAIFLAYDYGREFAARMSLKQIALNEEAKTLLPGVQQARHHGIDSVQQYVDAVCERMRDVDSPGHHIAVQLNGRILQATAHHRASQEILRAMRQAAGAPSRRAPLNEDELVVGVHKQGDTTVFVSESLSNLRRAVRRDVLRRLVGVALMALVGSIVINIVLIRLVTRPVGQLVSTVRAMAHGKLGTQADEFQSAEFSFLAGEINKMSSTLAAVDRNRKAQLTKAREIQQNALPQNIDVPGLNVAHIFQPTDDVSGDYYDALPLADGSWLFCVADVTGHGMTAATLKTLLLQATEHLTCPAEILGLISERLSSITLPGDFVSMLLVRTSPGARSLQYASAGHEPALLVTPDGTLRELHSTGFLLGIVDDAAWEAETRTLTPGERLLMVTDGVIETFNEKDACFGRQRLAKALQGGQQLPVDQAAWHIVQQLATYRDSTPQHDDVTLWLVEFA